ncbi:MAG: DUF2281 domain-containing protein [Leptolyngbyaceae cyanobacterium]
MIQPVILKKLEALPKSLQTEVLHYIEFLSERYIEKASESEPQKQKRSGFGIWKGKIWMSDDFDAPLEDMKDYM